MKTASVHHRRTRPRSRTLVAWPSVTAPKPWPKTMPEQVALIRDALAGTATVSAKALAKLYKGVGPEKVEEVLVTLAALGQARVLEDGRFVGVRAA